MNYKSLRKLKSKYKNFCFDSILKKMNKKIIKELKRLEEYHTKEKEINNLNEGHFSQSDFVKSVKRAKVVKTDKSLKPTFFKAHKCRTIRIGKKYQAVIPLYEETKDRSVLLNEKEILST